MEKTSIFQRIKMKLIGWKHELFWFQTRHLIFFDQERKKEKMNETIFIGRLNISEPIGNTYLAINIYEDIGFLKRLFVLFWVRITRIAFSYITKEKTRHMVYIKKEE